MTLSRVAILGAGYISEFHIAAIRRLPDAELVAICDVNEALAQQTATSFGIPAVYGSLETMLAAGKLNVVHVLTPPQTHAVTAKMIAAAGVDVFIEKPMCHTVAACQELRTVADAAGAAVGVGHNFLYYPIYERLVDDVRSGRLGQIDQVEIVWNKYLGQVRGGPFGAFMLAAPTNILFEVAPHSFAHSLHLVGMPDRLTVDVRDKVVLPTGKDFFRKWDVHGTVGEVSVRLRFSFIDGYPEHYIHVRGSNAVAHVDFEHNTYTIEEHTPYLLDADRLLNVLKPAASSSKQAIRSLGLFVASKAKLTKEVAPYGESIFQAVDAFYRTRGGELDDRVSAELGERSVRLGEMIALASGLTDTPSPSAVAGTTTSTASDSTSATSTEPAAGTDTGNAPEGTSKRPTKAALAAAAATETAATSATATVGATGAAASEKPSAGTVAPMVARPSVLVIGGTGFIGKALVAKLCAAGHSVRMLSRSPGSVPADLRALGVDVVRGDLTDAGSVDSALDGIDYVYHLGKGSGTTWADMLTSDVEPTERLGELCVKHNVKRLIYTSSIAIYAAGKRNGVITETTKASDGMARVAPYSRSKVENEERLMALHRSQGLPVVIFRPGVVLGAGGSPYHWGVAAWPYTSVCNLWGDGTNPLPIVLVDDVADALVLAHDKPGIDGESYNLASPPSITANDYLDEMERTAGIKLRRFSVPAWRLFAASGGKWAVKRAGRDQHARFPSYDDCDGRSLAATFDSSKAERDLGWTPERSRAVLLAKGVTEPVEAYLR
jgi:nucleoside-diphosphate-sugar epimerase/predicted dehydrogenase